MLCDKRHCDLILQPGFAPGIFLSASLERWKSSVRACYPSVMWYVFQLIIIIAVVFSNIHWHWTPNGYLASLLGIAAAWLCTRIIVAAVEMVRWATRRAKAQRSPRPGDRDRARYHAVPSAHFEQHR